MTEQTAKESTPNQQMTLPDGQVVELKHVIKTHQALWNIRDSVGPRALLALRQALLDETDLNTIPAPNKRTVQQVLYSNLCTEIDGTLLPWFKQIYLNFIDKDGRYDMELEKQMNDALKRQGSQEPPDKKSKGRKL